MNESEAYGDEWTDREPGGLEEIAARAAVDVRARRHPGVVLLLWAWLTVLGLAFAWPAASWVSAAYGGSVRGDGPLWDAGGLALLDFLWHGAWGLEAVTAAGAVVLLVGAAAGIVPGAASMFAMSHAPREGVRTPWRGIALASLGAVKPFATLLLFVSLAQAAILALGIGASNLLSSWTADALGEATAERLGASVAFVFVVVASGVGVVHDLARAAVVRLRAGGRQALWLGAARFGQSPLRLWWSWAWRAFAALVPVAAVGMVADRAGGRGGWTLAVLAVLHQGVILSRASLRASWLARAMRAHSEGP